MDVCWSQCNVVYNEPTLCLVQPIDNICMCVVNKKFELLEFVYVDLQYDEISLTSIARLVSFCCVCKVVLIPYVDAVTVMRTLLFVLCVDAARV